MVRIKGFKGIRPKKELASRIASVPYDVINSNEARMLVKIEPLSFLHVVKSEVDLPPETGLYDAAVYQKAHDNLEALIKDKMKQDPEPVMYVYRQLMQGRAQTGLIAVQHIDDYLDGKVKIHELTREDKEKDRIKHIDVVNAHTGPVFYTYKQDKNINSLIQSSITKDPEYDYKTKDGVQHTLWLLDDQIIINELKDAFGKIEYVYVADGHHRSKASAMVGKNRRETNKNHTGNEEYNWFLAVFFPADDLKIIDYNRVVRDLNGMSRETFLKKLEKHFKIKDIASSEKAKPAQEHEFGMYLIDQWFKLTLKENTVDLSDPVTSLDSALLTELILTPILGIENIRKDNRIDFVGGNRGMEALEGRVNAGEMALAFALHPITIKQLMGVADSNALMPPKTTWFEPKLQSGLFVHSLKDE